MNTDIWILQKNTLPAEVVVLLLMSMMMLILGVLLFPVYAGVLPYYEEGMFSLLFIVAALQTLALGKTPFGNLRRDLPTILLGLAILIFGIVVGFIPGIFGDVPRLLLILFFGVGGVLQLLWLFQEHRAERTRNAAEPLLGKLTAMCGVVYLFNVILGIILIFESLAAGLLMCIAVLGYGIAITLLTWILWQVYRKYPPEEPKGSISLPVGNVTLLLIGVFVVVLGILLIPVNLGLLPFAPSSQHGLLLVIFSLQMMLLGETPVGAFSRSHLIVGIGYLLGVVGVICCLIPNVLLVFTTILIAVANICGGVLGLGRNAMMIKAAPATNEPVPNEAVLWINIQILVLLIAINVLMILFGASMILVTLIPGLILGVILTANGCALLALLFLIRKADRLQAAAA